MVEERLGETQLRLRSAECCAFPVLSDPTPPPNPKVQEVQSSIRYELAGIYITHGDLERALRLYQESLQLKEQLGDKKGKAASLIKWRRST